MKYKTFILLAIRHVHYNGSTFIKCIDTLLRHLNICYKTNETTYTWQQSQTLALITAKHMHTHMHARTCMCVCILWLSGFCPEQPGWAGTRRNIHLLTPIVFVSHPLSASSIYDDQWHPPCSVYMPDSLFPQFLSKFSFSTYWPGTLQCILALTSLELCLFIFFSAAATLSILMQSAGHSLTSADNLWPHSFSSFISFLQYVPLPRIFNPFLI